MHPLENGQHREMAVDVPDHFVAHNKTQPRYPPPRTINNTSTPSTKPLPPPRMDSNNDRVTPQLPSREPTNAGKIGQILEPTNDQMDTIKKYQDQLRQRREKEERIAATNEFLRNSVRGSQKLATLKSEHIAPPPIGFDNDAYLIDEDDVNKVNLIGEECRLLRHTISINTSWLSFNTSYVYFYFRLWRNGRDNAATSGEFQKARHARTRQSTEHCSKSSAQVGRCQSARHTNSIASKTISTSSKPHFIQCSKVNERCKRECRHVWRSSMSSSLINSHFLIHLCFMAVAVRWSIIRIELITSGRALRSADVIRDGRSFASSR